MTNNQIININLWNLKIKTNDIKDLKDKKMDLFQY